MGTSVSQRSPKTLPWKAVWAGYIDETVPNDRMVIDIWRAVTSNQEYNVTKVLQSSLVHKIYLIVENSKNTNEALHNATSEIIKSKKNSIISEIAKRALVKSFLTENQGKTFKKMIFSETADYFVSRDLSGYINDRYRLKNINHAINFKNEVKERTIKKMPDNIEIAKYKDWADYIKNTISVLRGEKY